MKKLAKQMALLCVIGVGVNGCVTRGKDFSSNYSWIKEKQTRKSEVVKNLGDPFSVGYSSGRRTWTYGFYKFRAIGNSQTKELKIYWDQDVVDSFSFNSSFLEDREKALSIRK